MRKILLFLFLAFAFTIHAQTGERYSEEDIKLHEQLIRAAQKKLLRKYDDAIKLYEEILEKNRSNAVALFDLSRIYLAQDKEDEAITHGEKALKNDPNNTWYKTSLAEIKMKFKHFDEAAKMYEELAFSANVNEQLYLDAVEAYRKANNKNATLLVFERMEKVFGVDAFTAQQIIGIQLDNENYEAAIAKAHQLVNVYANEPAYLQLTAELETDFGSKKEAERLYKNLLKLDPENSKALVFLARNKDDSDGLSRIRSIVENNNINLDAKVKAMIPLATEIKASSPDKESIIALSKTIVSLHGEESKAYALLGDILNNSGQPEEAAPQYVEAIKLDKSVYSIWEQLMFIQYDIEDFEGLAKTSNDALDYYPNQAGPYVFQGLAQVNKNNLNEGKELLLEANLIGTNNKYIKSILNILSQTIQAYDDGDEVKVMNREELFMTGMKLDDPRILQVRADGKYLVRMKKGS